MSFYNINSADIKGDAGEVIITNYLRDELNTMAVRNIYLPYEDRTTEVDIVWITPKGIFCIECKNYEGYIKGSWYEDYWKVIYPNGYRASLYNPIKQNKIHSRALLKILEKEEVDINIYSVVIFTDKARLPSNFANLGVFTISEFKKLYRDWDSPNTYTSEVLDPIYSIIKGYSNCSDEAKASHVENLNKR